MNKLTTFIFLLPMILTTKPGFAQTEMDMDIGIRITEAEFISQAKQKGLQDDMELWDINSDNAISATEMQEAIKGIDKIYPSKKHSKEISGEIKQAYLKADSNKDNMLREGEIQAFSDMVMDILLEAQFKNMDINGDGVFDEKDLPSIEDSIKKLGEMTEKMQDLDKKIKSMDETEIADNFIKNMNSAIAKEDFFQMDKNRDGCVTKDEYVDYLFKNQTSENNSEETAVYLSQKEFSELYDIEKKHSPNCLTMDDYITNQEDILANFDENMEKESSMTYNLLDANHDGKLTADEFAGCTTTPCKEKPDEELLNMFKTYEGSKKGWLTKDEYVKHFL